MCRFLSAVILPVLMLGCAPPTADAPRQPAAASEKPAYRGDRVGHFGFGSDATPEQIAGWDIDVRPDGVGLPEGRGTVEDGEWLYEEQCAECHGSFGEGVGRYPVLAGGEGSLADDRPTRTVGSYWPYTSTLYDYIYRAMPFMQPESLSADETYAITAYVLYLNDLVEDEFELTHENLASIRLPNEPNFVPDPRPDVANVRCMSRCRDGEEIAFHSEVAPPEAEVPVEVAGVAAGDEAASHPGKGTYDQYCSICHKVGVGGAPVLGDVDAWSGRIDEGIDAVVSNAIKGISSESGVMPPKGGFVHLTDEDVADAVRYLVEESS